MPFLIYVLLLLNNCTAAIVAVSPGAVGDLRGRRVPLLVHARVGSRSGRSTAAAETSVRGRRATIKGTMVLTTEAATTRAATREVGTASH